MVSSQPPCPTCSARSDLSRGPKGCCRIPVCCSKEGTREALNGVGDGAPASPEVPCRVEGDAPAST
eukprot:15457946-Alexandrium_andersonii.AAC.1